MTLPRVNDPRRERNGTDVPEIDDYQSVQHDGRTIAYAEYGDPEGDPVVFLHGTPGCRLGGRLFDKHSKAFGVRVIAPDRPGYGRSSSHPERTLLDIGPIVEHVLADTGVDKTSVIGFSGGGPHALALAATISDRIERVDVISGTVPPALMASRPFTLRTIETLAVQMPRLLRGLFRLQSWLVSCFGPDSVIKQYTNKASMVSDFDAEVVAQEFQEAFVRYQQGIVTESRLLSTEWPFSVQSIDQPINLWHGSDDATVYLEGVRRLADHLPEAVLTVIESDHLGTLLHTRNQVLDTS